MSVAGWLKVQFSLVGMYVAVGMLFFVGVLLTASLFNAALPGKKEPLTAKA